MSQHATLSRKLRKHIQLALTGAALGAGFIAVPAYAIPTINYTVNTTSNSGTGSLNQAITDANNIGGTIDFSPTAFGNSFTSTLPSITGDVFIDQTSLNSFGVTQGLSTSGIGSLELAGNGTLGDISITTNLTANDDSYIGLSNAFTLNGDATADGANGVDNLLNVDNSTINGNITAINGGYITINNGSTITGNAIGDGLNSTFQSAIIMDASNVGTLNSLGVLQSGTGNVSTTNGGWNVVTGSNIFGNATADGVYNYTAGGFYNGYSSQINIDSSNVGTVNAGSLQTGTGNISATNGGILVITGSSNIYGNATADGVNSEKQSKIDIDDSNVGTLNSFGVLQSGTGNISATNGGNFVISGSSSIYGNATADGYNNGNQSHIEMWASNVGTLNSGTLQGGTGDISATNGGKINVFDLSHIYGNATADGVNDGTRSKIKITTSSIGNYDSSTRTTQENTGNLNAKNGGKISVDSSNIYGNATADGVNDGTRSKIKINSSAVGSNYSLTGTNQENTGNLNAENGGRISVNYSVISGNVTADGVNNDGTRSRINIEDSSLGSLGIGDTVQEGTGNLTATNGGKIDVEGSAIYGNIVANDNSQINLNGSIDLDGSNHIYGDATFNDSSMLRTYGFNNAVNTKGGTTAFAANATFAPRLTFTTPLQVDALSLNNSKLQPWYYEGDAPDSLPVGAENYIDILDYQSIGSGRFDSAVISPLNVGITYTNSEGPGSVQIYLKDNKVNFNNLPGNENQRAVGIFMSNYVNNPQYQPDPNELSLLHLPTLTGTKVNDILDKDAIQNYISGAAYDGNLSVFDDIVEEGELFTAQNTQAYWNQKSFIDSIISKTYHRNYDRVLHRKLVTSVNAIGVQLASLRQAMAPSLNRLNLVGNNATSRSGVWASYNGNHQSTDGDSGIGSNAWSSSSDGFTLGYTAGGDRFSWGVAAGHQKSTLNFADIGASGQQEGWNMGLYGSLKSKSTYLTGILGYGKYDNDTYGYIGDTSSKNKATSVSLELGKHLSDNKTGGLTPYASVLWTSVKQDEASIGGSGSGIVLKDDSNSVFTTELGMRYNHRMFDKSGTLKGGWQAGLAWLHQGGDTGLPANIGFTGVDGSIAIKGTPLAGNSLVVRLGAYGRIHGNLVGFAGYQGTFGSSQNINGVNAGVGYQF